MADKDVDVVVCCCIIDDGALLLLFFMLAVLGLRKDEVGTNASAVIHDVAAISISAEAKICDDWYIILYVYIVAHK